MAPNGATATVDPVTGSLVYPLGSTINAEGHVTVGGCDLVEVSPPFDPSGGTAFLGASIMFELLCAMAARPAA